MTTIISDEKLDFDDVLIKPKRSVMASRAGVNLKREFKFYHSDRVWNGFPIIASNLDTTGSFDMGKYLHTEGAITCLHKYYDFDKLRNFFSFNLDKLDSVWYTLGMRAEDVTKLDSLVNTINAVPNICIDVANGYSETFVDFVQSIREKYKNTIIMAGNVATPEMVQELIIRGADIVKIGIGGGSLCTTRKVTGVGYPQLSAIMECAEAAHGLKSSDRRLGLICADGGCRTSGDVAKAFGANADFVMLGGMLVGTDECEGEWDYCNRITYTYNEFLLDETQLAPDVYGNSKISTRNKELDNIVKEVGSKRRLKAYGMSSEEAQEKYSGGVAAHRTSEGKETVIDYKGPASKIISEIQGGLRSCCAYIGANCIKDMAKCTTFIKVNRVHYENI